MQTARDVVAYWRRIPVLVGDVTSFDSTLMIEVEPHFAVNAAFLHMSTGELKAAKEAAKRFD